MAAFAPQGEEKRLVEALQKAGLRLTPQRLAICRYLVNTDEHPTAQEIHRVLKEDFPSLSLATVYNTLETLVSLGAIHAVGDAGDDRVHYDADITPHINLVCIRCHRIIDVPHEALSHLEEEAAARSGYRILGARLVYYGLCPACQRLESEKEKHGSTSVAA